MNPVFLHFYLYFISLTSLPLLLVALRSGAEKREQEDCLYLEEWVQSSVIPECSPQRLQAAMQLVNIQTLAFTPPHTLPWRVYLYTHTQYTQADNTLRRTLIMGELLYAGGVGQSEAEDGVWDVGGAEGGGQEDAARRGDWLDGDGGGEGVKVTLKQQPRDDDALQGFLSILTSALHTLSAGRT